MIRTIALVLGLGAATSALVVASQEKPRIRQPLAQPGQSPVVLELFQSQGCSSCPPALAVLREEADRPDVIALNFAVTYWDQLGWKDSFAQPAFTQRQWDYAHANGRDMVATPQLIVNGRGFVNGGDRAEVDAAIGKYRGTSDAPSLRLDRNQLIVRSAPRARPATVWLVTYDPRTLKVPIHAGENDGRTLAHRNIVRALENLGSWIGPQHSYQIPQGRPGLARAILIQVGTGGPIIAARKLA
jgi:hypothetical protein